MKRFNLPLFFAFLVAAGCSAGGEFSVSNEDTSATDEDTLQDDTSDDDTGETETDTADDDVATTDGVMFDPCTDDNQCVSNFCLDFEGSQICTELCAGDTCPDGWECKTLVNSGTDAVRLCVPGQDSLCGGCETNTDCGIFGDQCITVGGRDVCGRDCSVTRQCPDGYTCTEIIDVAGNTGEQCVPISGVCSCDPEETPNRPCVRTSEWGVCEGVEVCNGDAGWSVCSADPPSEEICDGRDNDCDNLVDEDMDSRPCLGPENEIGVCEGTETCNGEAGWSCDAPTASIELCDELDNDCNGVVDDGICFDGNSCTYDICLVEGGCDYVPHVGPCDDGNACTTGEICDASGMCSGTPTNCDDGNPCTNDSCNPTTGCVNAPADGAPCETGNLCTNDVCQGGVCTVGTLITCPNRQCNDSECRPDQGCVDIPLSGMACDDDDSCTNGERCSSGNCVGGVEMDCSYLSCEGSFSIGTCISGICLCIGF